MSLPSNQLSHNTFNNFVVITRAKVKQVLVRTCHRITREIPKYKNYKGDSEEFKSKKKKKGNRLAREIKIMKKLNHDDITKFALQFDKKADAILNDTKANIKLKVLVKLSLNKILKDAVEQFRRKYPNWKVEIPNIIRNIELKKKGMKLNEDIARGEDERMKKLDKYPEANDGVQRKLNKEKSKLSKINGSIDSLNNWKVESKSNNRTKGKPNKVKQKKGESLGLEEDSNDDVEDNEEDDDDDESLEDNEEDDQSTDDNEEDELVDDNEENNELAFKLSNALKKIAPGSDDELESENDSDASQESEAGSSDDAFEEERRKRKLEMMKGMAKKTEESSEEEEEEDDSSSEDEFEEERRKRKMELLRLNGKLSKNKHTDNDDDDGESSDEDIILNESKSKQKNNVVKNTSKKTKNNKLTSNGKVKNPKKNDTKLLKSTTTLKETSETVKKETIKTTQKKVPVETVVDDFFMTKDNKEYLSSVKPNAAPEPSERESDGDVYKPRKPQFTDAKPKDMYRKGKKVVLNKNRASFSNFENKSSYSRDRPSNQPRKFNSEKTDRFGGAAGFHDRRSGGRFNGKFEKPLTAGGSGEKLHPSWEAKKRHQPAITHFKGKKIKFDE